MAGNSRSWLRESAVTEIAVVWTTSQQAFQACTPDIAEK